MNSNIGPHAREGLPLFLGNQQSYINNKELGQEGNEILKGSALIIVVRWLAEWAPRTPLDSGVFAWRPEQGGSQPHTHIQRKIH